MNLSLPGADVAPRELVSRRIMRVKLRDKPVGYSLGNYGKRVLIVELCPKCGDAGARISPMAVAHVFDFFDERGEPRFQKQDVCKLELRNTRGYGPLLPNGRF